MPGATVKQSNLLVVKPSVIEGMTKQSYVLVMAEQSKTLQRTLEKECRRLGEHMTPVVTRVLEALYMQPTWMLTEWRRILGMGLEADTMDPGDTSEGPKREASKRRRGSRKGGEASKKPDQVVKGSGGEEDQQKANDSLGESPRLNETGRRRRMGGKEDREPGCKEGAKRGVDDLPRKAWKTGQTTE